MSYSTHTFDEFKLQSGEIMINAHIAYKTFGVLGENNVIIYPTWYSGFISDNEWLVGEGRALDPKKYFIIIIAMLNNSESSNSKGNVSLYDNVIAQHRLVTEKFGIKKIKLVTGWSMGAQQTYQWACLFPEMVESIVPFCGSARTSPHNFVFLEGLRNILHLEDNDERLIKSFARVYAGWGLTQAFYKEKKWEELGYRSLEDFLVGFWENFFLKRDRKNLLAHIWSWQNGDISDNPVFNKDFTLAMKAIKAKTIIIAPENDLYFPKEDNQDEEKMIENSKLVVIPGVWGHFSGGGINNDDTIFINRILSAILEL